MTITEHLSIYTQLKEISALMERVVPLESTPHLNVACSPQEIVVEAKATEIWRLNLDVIHTFHTETNKFTKRVHKKWHIRRKTQLTSTCTPKMISEVGNQHSLEESQKQHIMMPSGIKLWHACQKAQRLLLLAKHDLQALFQEDSATPISHKYHENGNEGQWQTSTLLITPTRMLGYKEGMTLLGDKVPYLSRLCSEYAHMAARLYGLSLGEFCSLAKMNVTRHSGGMPIRLQETGGGLYDSGPILTVGVGKPHIYHDFSPILMPQSDVLGSIRVMVPEGVMVAIDGYARSSYGHGHAIGGSEGDERVFYSINYFLDSMRETVLLGYVRETGDVVMHTPVIPQNVVQFNTVDTASGKSQSDKQGMRVRGRCPVRDLIQDMRTHLQTVESERLL